MGDLHLGTYSRQERKDRPTDANRDILVYIKDILHFRIRNNLEN